MRERPCVQVVADIADKLAVWAKFEELSCRGRVGRAVGVAPLEHEDVSFGIDGDGKLLRQIHIDVPFDPNAQPAIGNKPGPNVTGTMAPGAPWAVCITPGPTQYLYSSDAYPGRVYKLTLDGKVLGVLGGAGKQLKQFGWIHEIACPSENELYVGELLNWRVQKLLLHPTATQISKK